MKVLIVGDFSSAGYYLQMGFISLGVQATHIAYQNGWRENPIEINLTSNYKGFLGKAHNYIKPFTLKNLKGYDVVIFLDYFTFPRTFGINSYLTKMIQDENKTSYLWVMGCDSKMREWGKVNNFELCNSCLKFDQMSVSCICEKDQILENNFLKGISKIVPACYEYYEAHKNDDKITNIIQLPIFCNSNIVKKKNSRIKFLHGLNRYGFKGTNIVENAFNQLKHIYRKSAEFEINGKMNFKDYNSLLSNQDVIIDQVYNKSLGINSLLTLSQGKILLAGNPISACKMIGAPLPPMIIIDSNVESLKNAIIDCIENFEKYESKAQFGRDYVKTFHSPKIIAAKFLDLFYNNNLS